MANKKTNNGASNKTNKEASNEQKQYFIKVEGQEVPVTEEVYRAYIRPVWKEHKRLEREKARECGPNVSLDQMIENNNEIADDVNIEDIVADSILLQQLMSALGELADNEIDLIKSIFYENKSERDIAKETNTPQTTISYRKKKILKKLREIILKNKF